MLVIISIIHQCLNSCPSLVISIISKHPLPHRSSTLPMVRAFSGWLGLEQQVSIMRTRPQVGTAMQRLSLAGETWLPGSHTLSDSWVLFSDPLDWLPRLSPRLPHVNIVLGKGNINTSLLLFFLRSDRVAHNCSLASLLFVFTKVWIHFPQEQC